MEETKKDSPLPLGLLYLGSGLVVIVYVNLYGLYSLCKQFFGSSFITFMPLLVPLLLLSLAAAMVRYRRQGRREIDWRLLLAGIGLCIVALTVPDPRIGVKRIHVSEYLALSLLVRYAMAHRLQGPPLLLFSALFTGVLGIHDECLQGLHPQRTYGLRDMLVNGLSGTGGALIYHAMAIFSLQARRPAVISPLRLSHALYLIWLLLSVLALVMPLTYYLHSPIPYWLLLPLAASLVYWGSLLHKEESPLHHGLAAVSFLCFLLLLYPIMINGLQLPFA